MEEIKIEKDKLQKSTTNSIVYYDCILFDENINTSFYITKNISEDNSVS